MIGKVGGDELRIEVGDEVIELALSDLRTSHRSLEALFQ